MWIFRRKVDGQVNLDLDLIPPQWVGRTWIIVYRDTHKMLKFLKQRLGCRNLDMVIRRLARGDIPPELIAEATKVARVAASARKV